jgi:hypothetical protein
MTTKRFPSTIGITEASAYYLAQAERLREIPLASSPIERYLQHLT